MMRRRLLIFLLLLPGLAISAQVVPDYEREEQALADSLDAVAAKYAPLDSLLTQFYGALELEETEAKNAEFDALIGSCRDSLARQHVALAVFDHYRYSRIMGEEAVALHIFDEWIAPGKVQTRSEFELFEAERFAMENRKTQIGMPAPILTLRTPCGGKRTIPAAGRPAVLFFYSPHCSKCRLETHALPAVLADVEFPLNFYAIDVDTDRRDFKNFRKALRTANKKVKMIHLWDPDSDSSLLLDYGVFSTPKVFLVWEDGEILGRRLEMDSLQQMIHYINILYGQKKEEQQEIR